MSPVSDFRSVISGNLKSLGLYEKARKYQVFALWPKIVGSISQQAVPRRFDGDILLVATSSSLWSQELTYMSRTLKNKINKQLGGEYVREIRFSEHLWDYSSKATHYNMDNKTSIQDNSLVASRTKKDADVDLEALLQRVRDKVRARNTYLVSKGYRICEKCGGLFEPSKKSCPFCKIAQELSWHKRATALLEKQPELSNEEVMVHCDIGSKEIVDKARRQIDAKCSLLLRVHLAKNTRYGKEQVEVVKLCKKLVSLRTCSQFDKLDEKTVAGVLGRRFYSILKKGATSSD